MSENIKKIGDFCWAELYAKNISKSLKFYASIFDWKEENISLPENKFYTLLKIHEKSIAGGIQLSDDMGDLRPHWNSYILVADIHKTLEKAIKLGAKSMSGVSDCLDIGKYAVILDPTGASFTLWQSMKLEPEIVLKKNVPNNIGWNELITEDIDKAKQFYMELFGWEDKTMASEYAEKYTVFMNEGTPAAGMRTPTEKLKTPGPRWWVYFTVSNLDASIDKIRELGGNIKHDPITIPLGRFIMIEDPGGVCFSIIEYC